MALFLTRAQVYRILERELPEDVYPDGPEAAFYSTADMASVADCAATGYANLERIYDNYWPQTADESIAAWEIKVFGKRLDASLTLEEEREKVIDWIRSRKGITLWDILLVVLVYVPSGTYVEIFENNGQGNSWRLGVSKLGVSTFLGLNNGLSHTGEDACAAAHQGWILGGSYLGVSTYLGSQELKDAQQQAYSYEVRIFDYTLPDLDYQNLQIDLARFEPARSNHKVLQNLSLIAYGLINVVPNVDQFSLVNCVAKDNTQTTGYIGRTR